MTYPWIDNLWTEIAPGLWQGGTDDLDQTGQAHRDLAKIPTRTEFDSVYTLYAKAGAVGWHVKEMRFGFYDSDMDDFDVVADLTQLVKQAHLDWVSGRRVLVRCYAGLNRSGLVTALVLIRAGYTPQAAIDLIRKQRGDAAMSNPDFERWLLNTCDTKQWREGLAA